MANDIIVSEMTSATQINTNDLMIMTQPDPQAETGYSTKKGTVLQVANKMLKGTEYLTDLPDFTDKTVLGGLEELKGDLTALLPVDTASGAIANFDTDLSLPLVDCKASIVATQASGTPTPSSPLAISGYTGVNLSVCGVNLWELSDDTKFDSQNCSYVYENNGVNITASGMYARISYVIPVKVGQKYTFSFYGQGTANFINVYYNNANSWGDSYGRSYLSSTRTKYTKTITANSDVLFVGFYVTSSGTTGDMVIEDFMLEVGSTASDTFNAYNGTTYAVSWQDEAGTVYGGNLDLTTGLLTVTWGSADMGELSYSYEPPSTGIYGRMVTSDINTLIVKSEGSLTPICEKYHAYNNLSAVMNSTDGFWESSAGNISFTSAGYTDAASFKTAMSGTKFVYPLATPVTYQLTPVQVQALLGVNNVFNDTNGDTEVKYKEGIQHYIDKKIAATQALIL